MTPDEARKIIGGYATGNLTRAERQALFEAALNDQDLFDALAKEEALKEVLADPESRQRLLGQLQPPRRGIFGDLTAWRWAAAASVALATVVIAVVVIRRPVSPAKAPVLTAMSSSSAPLQAAPPPPAPPEKRPVPKLESRLAHQRSDLQDQNEVDKASPAKVVKEAPPDAAPEHSAPATAVAASAPATAEATSAPAPVSPAADVLKGYQAAALAKDVDEPLRYQVLRRGADGTFTEVPPQTLFETGDAVRLRVFSPAAGMIFLTKGTNLLGSVVTEPGRAYLLPPESAIDLSTSTSETHLALAFTPSQGNRGLMRFRQQAQKREEKPRLSAASGAVAPAMTRSVEVVLRHR